MRDFICELCNKKFTTKYGLQKHKNNVICNEKVKKKPIFQCSLCEKILSSKQNLKSHEAMCKLKKLEDKLIKQTNNFTKIINNDNLIEDNIIQDNLIDDKLIEDNLIEDKNLAIDNNIMIPIQDYNFFKCKINYLTDENQKLNSRLNKLDSERQKLDNENQKLKDEIIKLNNIVSEINTNTNNINITNNIYHIQINIISFMDNKMILSQIFEIFLCTNSPLYDMTKLFNYEKFHYPIAKNGLNRLQKYQESQIKKMVYNDRKIIIKNANLGFCYILDKYFENPRYKNLRHVKATILEYYNGAKWLPTTVYSSKRILVYSIIDAIDKRPKLNIISSIDRAMDFLVNDYHKNYEEYLCCDNDEFINMIKRIHI